MSSANILGIGLCLLAMASASGSSQSSGAATGDVIVAGVQQGDGGAFVALSPTQQPSGTLAAGQNAIDIDFDDVSAPCDFSSTQALRGEYAAQGAVFWGQGPFDGGAILNECSNFGVSGYSAPNFLAFNSGAGYGNGGVASAPEFIRLLLPSPVQHIELRAGSGSGTGPLTLIGVRADGTTVASSTITLGPALQTVAVSGQGIVGAIITTSAGVFVVDDLIAN
jgi:hypothetical protein